MQRAAGGGVNLTSALSILNDLQRQRPDFFFVKPGDRLPNGFSWSYLNGFLRYYARDFAAIGSQTIAEDLVWLIRETREKFATLTPIGAGRSRSSPAGAARTSADASDQRAADRPASPPHEPDQEDGPLKI